MAYTFKPTQYGTVEVYQDGRRVSTGTPQVAEQYGYNVPVSSVSMSSSLPAPISVSGLSENVQAINPPPAPTDTTDYGAILANTGPIVAPPPPTTEKTEISLIEKYLAGATPPPSQEQAFRTAEEEAGIQAKQQAVLEQQRKEQAARNRLNALNAQLNAISTESKATQERLLQEATGRGITVGGLQPMQAGELRKSALAAFPIQAQVYGAQEALLAAQGDTEGARRTLELAQDRLDTTFKLKSEDAQRTYDYWKDIREKVLDFATEAEKTKLEAQQTNDTRIFQEKTANIRRAQDISDQAWKAGQSNVAIRIAQLDPTSPTFTEDLARLQGKIRIVPVRQGAEQPLSILDVGRYQEIYPDAGINAGDTEASANAKVLQYRARKKEELIKEVETYKNKDDALNDLENNRDVILGQIGIDGLNEVIFAIEQKFPEIKKEETPGIIGTVKSFFGRLFGASPVIAATEKNLEIEERLQTLLPIYRDTSPGWKVALRKKLLEEGFSPEEIKASI